MATRNQLNIEFQNEVHEILGRHESSIDEVHVTLQAILQELQSMRASQIPQANYPDTNLFAPNESSHQPNLHSASHP